MADSEQRKHLEYRQRPEYIIGIVGAIGVDWDAITESIAQAFTSVGYTSNTLRLSEMLTDLNEDLGPGTDKYDEIRQLMEFGDRLRKDLDHHDAMAFLAIAAIRRERERIHRDNASKSGPNVNERANSPVDGHAHIIRSLKRPEEVALLRSIYGGAFQLVSAYAPRRTRLRRLSSVIENARRGDQESYMNSKPDAERLILRDEKDRTNKYGQDVLETFPEADLFVDAANSAEMRNSIARYVELLFGNHFRTPSRDEIGMFHAHAASRRSADLARQVGAAIATSEGDIVAVGCNDVPKAGGGQYWEGDDPDVRDFQLGYDSSDPTKISIADEAVRTLHRKWKIKPGDLSDSHIDSKQVLDGTQLMDVIEFGRSVHAEMAALMDAARRGVTVHGATLFSTTFPCHMCARHIVASGIRRVVFVEPYPKSRVQNLFADSVALDSESAERKVAFEPFRGVAPRQFLGLYSLSDPPGRKDRKNGKVIQWAAAASTPKLRRYVASFVLIELRAETRLLELLSRLEERGGGAGGSKLIRWLKKRKTIYDDEMEKAPKWLREAIERPRR